MTRRYRAHGLLFALIIFATGCARVELNTGEECSLNSDCGEPLVCQLEYCRRQCVDSRDCGAGLLCLRIGSLGGVCQLPGETRCSLRSHCPNGLECLFGTCTTACREDRDCTATATCSEDEGGLLACVEPVTELCIFNTDCPAPLICDPEQVCRYECVQNVDCTSPRLCLGNLCELPSN